MYHILYNVSSPVRKEGRTMKKLLTCALLLLIGLVAGAAIMYTIHYLTDTSPLECAHEGNTATADTDNAELTALAFEVLGYIRDGDYQGLSRFAHPEFGVVFTPYATISLNANRFFTAEQIADFDSDTTIYIWGAWDGIGGPIEKTPEDYFARFVYSRDFVNAPIIGINHIIRSGNALENIREIFPDVQFVDFFCPGELNDGMDWRSLRLGFEKYEGELKLTLILSSEWTV